MRRTAGLWALTAILFLNDGAQPVTAQATGEKIVGGPYAVNVGPRSATVVWLVQKGEGALGTAPGKMEKSAPIVRSESITFAGLVPGTTYYYQSFPGDAGKGSFKTPPVGTAKFQFVVYGDTRTRHVVHKTVVEGILKYAAPDFLIHTGDLVAEGGDTSLWPIFFQHRTGIVAQNRILPRPGKS